MNLVFTSPQLAPQWHLWVLVPQSTVVPGTSMSSQVHLKRRVCEPPWDFMGAKSQRLEDHGGPNPSKTIQNQQLIVCIFCKLKDFGVFEVPNIQKPTAITQFKLNASVIFLCFFKAVSAKNLSNLIQVTTV